MPTKNISLRFAHRITCRIGLFISALLLARGISGGAVETDSVVNAVIAEVKPSLVKIHVISVVDQQGRETKYESSGSGVIVTERGHVVTNHHVAGNARRIVCTMTDRREIEAEPVGSDPLTDIAVIKLRGPPERVFPAARFGNSSSVKVGDRVMAMGSPLALSQSVTMGIVSNTDLVMPELYWPFDKMTIEGEDVGTLVKWIGHDAAIFNGNSGGPLVNMRGEVVGINEINMGISAAIPGNLVREVSRALIEKGAVTRAWTGLEVQPLLRGSVASEGVLVAGAIDESPAAEAGFQRGDILLRLGDEPVTVRFPEQLPGFNRMVMALPIGIETEVLVRRDDREKRLAVVPVEREYLRPRAIELKKWGITVRAITMPAAREMRRDNTRGVLVTSVRPGGPCGDARPAIRDGDVIVEVERRTITGPRRLQLLTDTLAGKATEPHPLLVTFSRNRENHVTVVEVGLRSPDRPTREARKAWLPVAMQVVTEELSAKLGIDGRTGMRITRVYPHPSVHRAGLETGDVIVALDGEEIPVQEPEDFEILPAMIRQYDIGATATLSLIRGGKEKNVRVKLPASPKSPREMEKYRDEDFEFTVRNITFMDRVAGSWERTRTGVLVDAVDGGGWAALGNLAVGDLVVGVNDEEVEDIEAVERIMSEVRERRKKRVVLSVRRGIHNLFVELEPDWSDEQQHER